MKSSGGSRIFERGWGRLSIEHEDRGAAAAEGSRVRREVSLPFLNFLSRNSVIWYILRSF